MAINVCVLLIIGYPTVLFLSESLSFSVDFHRFCKWPIMSSVNNDKEATPFCKFPPLSLFYHIGWLCPAVKQWQ